MNITKLLFPVLFLSTEVIMAQAIIDSNSNCAQATRLLASYQYAPLLDSLKHKQGNGFYAFTANSSSMKIKGSAAVEQTGSISIILDSACTKHLTTFDKGDLEYVLRYSGLMLGKKYTYSVTTTNPTAYRTGVLSLKKENDLSTLPSSFGENNAYVFSYGDYSKGRDANMGCQTTFADSNVIDLFLKFTASSVNQTIVLDLDNPSVDDAVTAIGSFDCFYGKQVGLTRRYYPFGNLTIGKEYILRIELASKTPLGYARLDNSEQTSAGISSVSLYAGIITSIEQEGFNYEINVRPNPTTGEFTIDNEGKYELTVYDLLGNEIVKDKTVIGNEKTHISLQKGLYILKISSLKTSALQKLMVE